MLPCLPFFLPHSSSSSAFLSSGCVLPFFFLCAFFSLFLVVAASWTTVAPKKHGSQKLEDQRSAGFCAQPTSQTEPSQAKPSHSNTEPTPAKPSQTRAKPKPEPSQHKQRGPGDKGTRDRGTRGPGDRGTRGLGGQGTWGPGTRGCKDNITTEWLSGGAKFPIPDRPGRPRLVHRRRVWKHDSLQRRWDFGGYKDETIMITIVARECSTMTLDIIPLRNDTIRVYPAGSRFHALNLNSQCPRPTCSSERGVNSVYLEISTEATIRKPESDLSPKHDVLSSCRGSELGILRRPTQEWSGGGASSFRLLALLLHLFLLLDSVCN